MLPWQFLKCIDLLHHVELGDDSDVTRFISQKVRKKYEQGNRFEALSVIAELLNHVERIPEFNKFTEYCNTPEWESWAGGILCEEIFSNKNNHTSSLIGLN